MPKLYLEGKVDVLLLLTIITLLVSDNKKRPMRLYVFGRFSPQLEDVNQHSEQRTIGLGPLRLLRKHK